MIMCMRRAVSRLALAGAWAGLMVSGWAGQSVFLDPVSGRDVIAYHYIRKSDPVGSQAYLGINYLDFSSGWPVVVG